MFALLSMHFESPASHSIIAVFEGGVLVLGAAVFLGFVADEVLVVGALDSA